MYQPDEDISELVSSFIASPQDPLLREQVAAFVAADPEQAVYVENRLLAWLEEGRFVRPMPPAPVMPVNHHRSFSWKWLAAATIALLIIAGAWLLWEKQPAEMLLYTNHTGRIDTLQLEKGSSSVITNKGTTLTYAAQFEVTPEVSVITGDAYFNIHREHRIRMRLDEHTVLYTANAVFNVHRTASVFQVYVVKGRVTLVPDKGNKLQLTANMQAKRELHQPVQKKTVKSPSLLAWKTGRLKFRNVPLEEVLDAVNGYYGLEILVPPSADQLYRRRLTADFENKSAAEMLGLLHKALNAPIVKDSANRYYVTIK
ncbi:hypothetical protein HGH93_23075 [Chitinophaga polysaccharea]|uniref:FecR family protein n=1 Tax=Chitinophaga TaxID=79328 RepID=UPI0014556DDD|nr:MULTISPECIES: FecR domain-containing protein [Chitinophaga]NLR61004.1 hypothetical protein [Chitinophaga polysaccharea]NLU96213.1 hypothetical protein [Chitinophaga sp. Ak27]